MTKTHIPQFQGDIGIVKLDSFDGHTATYCGNIKVSVGPELLPRDGWLVVGHSETGHHHAVNGGPNVAQLFGTSNPDVSVLRVLRPTTLEHLKRIEPIHAPHTLEPGDYAISRQRERRPAGWARVID